MGSTNDPGPDADRPTVDYDRLEATAGEIARVAVARARGDPFASILAVDTLARLLSSHNPRDASLHEIRRRVWRRAGYDPDSIATGPDDLRADETTETVDRRDDGGRTVRYTNDGGFPGFDE